MQDHYFVKVFAKSKRQLAELQQFDLDLFQPTARAKDREATIEGLLTLEQVERLVKSGYQVLVEQEASERARAREVVEFPQWLEERKPKR